MKSVLASLAAVVMLTACNASGPASSLVPRTDDGAGRTSQDFLGGAARTTQDFLGGAPCAKLNGTITNGTGKPVSNASVLTMDVSGHLINVTATGSDGKFTLHALPPGAYTIVVKNSYVTASGETVKATGNDAGAAPSQFVVLSPEDNLRLNTLVD